MVARDTEIDVGEETGHKGNAGQMEDVGAGGGWSWVLSDLKTLLETGKPLAGWAAVAPIPHSSSRLGHHRLTRSQYRT